MLQWQLSPFCATWRLWTLCGWAPLLCPLFKVLDRFQSQLTPATWKCLCCDTRAVGTALVSPLLRFAVQAAAFDLWKSWFESSLRVRPLSPGLCWQSGLAGLYFVDNLVFKSERTSAEFSVGQGGHWFWNMFFLVLSGFSGYQDKPWGFMDHEVFSTWRKLCLQFRLGFTWPSYDFYLFMFFFPHFFIFLAFCGCLCLPKYRGENTG